MESKMRSFATGIQQDIDAFRNAITLPWNNSQVEGQVHRVKLIKRQMYRCAKIGLLRVRVIKAG
jgi:transposase